MFRPGEADAALNCIIRLIDRDIASTSIDAGKQLAHVVAGAFMAAPVSSAANAILSTIVNLRLYTMMAKEMDDGNRLLRSRQYSLDLFNASPLLGCYFLITADVGVWINFSIWDIGVEGWMDTVAEMRERSEPALDKARQYIRLSKYCLSGTEGYKGIEWETKWRNNKLAFLKGLVNTRSDQLGGVDYLLKQVA